MAASKQKKKTEKNKQNESQPVYSGREPWMSYKTGLVAISITSIFMAVLTAWQAIPARGLVGGILWGIVFGGLIWAVFFGYLLFNRFIRRL
jgi:hypothetical protein